MPEARPATIKGVTTAVKQFLTFGEAIKKKVGARNKLEALEARVTFSTIRAYNNHFNALKNDTAFDYTRAFLLYYAKKWGDPVLQAWGESLVHTYQERKSLFAKPGEKASIEWGDVEKDLKTYYSVVTSPATRTKEQRTTAFRCIATLLFGVTTGMRPAEMERIDWEEIKHGIEKGYFILTAEKAKTRADRVTPIHPAIAPYLQVLSHLYKNKPFDTHNYRKYRARDGATLNIGQTRNFAAKYWPDKYRIKEKIRIAIMGHDEGQIMREITAEEREDSVKTEVTDTHYRKYGIEEITAHYMETVGKNFRPIPKGIDLKVIEKSLEGDMKYNALKE
ncbi:hypothetical protein [Methanoculleus sp. UBA374]